MEMGSNGLNKSVHVLYGSETGNAQDMAEELGRMCSRLHFTTQVEAMNSVDLVSGTVASHDRMMASLNRESTC